MGHLASSGPRPLLIAGSTDHTAHLALRRLLRAKEPAQALLVIDYQGLLAHRLTAPLRGNLHKAPVIWCDLANRRRPCALFRFGQTAGMRPALRAFLQHCSALLGKPVSGRAVEATVDLAYRLAAGGRVGLGSLAQCLRRPELAGPLRGQDLAQELDQLVALLDWMLAFPAVWAASEGNNFLDLRQQAAIGATVWLELPATHFERVEHQLVAWMVEAVTVDLLLSGPTSGTGREPMPSDCPLILYGYPAAAPLPMEVCAGPAKHVGTFQFSASHPLPAAARGWLDADADCWVTGHFGELPAKDKAAWLSEGDRSRLRELQPGQVWARSGANGTAVTMLMAQPGPHQLLAPGYRQEALKTLRLASVRQFSTALSSTVRPAPRNADLFRKLCNKDSLYAGWFRVKGHNRQSHGIDRVTIQQFGAHADTHVEQLSAELSEGRYHCRPLRTARIPKPDGQHRTLKIACVRDRVVQAACLHLIEPLFETQFSAASFAYRPGRGAHHALAMARAAIRGGKQWAVIADIRKCFDMIDHDILLRLVGDVIGDRELLQLIRHWLTADVFDFMDILPSDLGVPQGESISPLLANVYLDPLDKEFERIGATFVRYADDYLVLCETEAEARAMLAQMTDFLQSVLRLALKPAKTLYCRVSDGIEFLGFRMTGNAVSIPADRVSRMLRMVTAHVEALAVGDSPPAERQRMMLKLNAMARGFRNYFLVDDSPVIRHQLAEMDAAVEARGNTHLPQAFVLELAWSGRDRFLPTVDGTTLAEAGEAEAAQVSGAYPEGGRGEHLSTQTLTALTTAPPSPVMPPARDALTGEPAPPAGEPDFMLTDGRLHVMTSGCYIALSAEHVTVKKRKVEVFRCAVDSLTMLYVEGRGIAMSTDLTMHLCDRGIPVVFSPLIGKPAAIAQPLHGNRSTVRQQQVLRRNDPQIIKTGLGMLAAKVANQASVLKYFARYRKKVHKETHDQASRGADELRQIAKTLEGLDPASASVRSSGMGHEGHAAARYWAMFSLFVPQELAFPGRHTQHATDRVNSAINYVYGVLYGEVWRAVVRAGLDPYFGIVHGTERDQGSLVFDLIEEFRAPFGDRVVLGMLGRGFHLDLDKDGLLRPSCRAKIVAAFHKQWHRAVSWRGRMRTPADILQMQAQALKAAFLGEGEYNAFRFRW